MSIKDKIIVEKIPQHIAIIMDGNGRWAKNRGEDRIFGHRHGVRPIRETTEAAAELGVKYLTLYAFSSENWNRPKHEVEALMQLLVQTIHKETETLNKNNIRLQAIGDFSQLSEECHDELMAAIDNTSGNSRMTLILALSYGARSEIIYAAQRIAKDVAQGTLSYDALDEDKFSQYLYTQAIPDPEMLIRTSGEQRISNFLLWQIAYAELFFLEVLWPDFNKEHFYQAVVDYQKRQRRFGMTDEQMH